MSRRKFAAAGLLGFLAGCALQKPLHEEASRSMTSLQQEQAILQHEWRVSSFKEYNPPETTSAIPLDSRIADFVVYGLDVRENKSTDDSYIEDIIALRERFYLEAAKHGYTPEKIKTLSPKETIELQCKITADVFDYFGSDTDWVKAQRRSELIESIERTVEKIEHDADAGPSMKQSASTAKIVLEKLQEAYGIVRDLERALGKQGSDLTSYLEYDRISARELFDRAGKTGIICRQTAKLQCDLFAVVKLENPQLKNTFVARYQWGGHCWNQVTTLARNGDTMVYHVSFFDPTFYNGCGDLEGYSPEHFGEGSITLANQLTLVKDLTETVATSDNLTKK